MKRILLFILPILIVVTLAFTVLGVIQGRFEQERLLDDLRRKAKAVAESMELSVRQSLKTGDYKDAHYIVEKFQTRERLQGCAIYDKQGEIVAVTRRFADWKNKEKPYIQDVLATQTPHAALEDFKGYSVYSFVLPVLDDQGQVLGLIEVIHDTSYVFARLTEIWERLSVTLIILVILIAAIALLIQWRIFVLPVKRMTEWFQHFQKGEVDAYPPIKDRGELGKLASEVEEVALTLRVARRAISDEAHVQLQQEEQWTEGKLRSLIQARLGENALLIVSNREPYMHVIDEATGKARCFRPPSGVVTAIDPIMRACGGVWVAHGSGNADRKFVNSKNKLGVPPEDNRYILKRVWLTKEEEAGYYYGFANEGLWPLCHVTHTRPIFRDADWRLYKKVNQKFAEAVIEEMPAKSPFVLIQDFHFTLLGRMIKEKRPDATVALFWHIPWPNPEVFAICPYQKEILDGILGCDLVGFHLQFHCNNFLDTANRLLECRVDTEKFSVVSGGKETFIKAFPISVPPGPAAPVEPATIEKIREEHGLKDKIVVVGVDRIDYTKGLIERVLAIDRFLEISPQHKKKIVFIQLCAPSRVHIKRYRELAAEIDELVDKKNWKYSEDGWEPILYLKRHFSPEEIAPFYKLADVCIVSSLHDGMNLVAKEFVASRQDGDGVLVLSRFTGAARELTDAVQMNPYSIAEFADAIKTAVEMPLEERRKRMEGMRRIVNEYNVYRWAGSILTDLFALKKD